MDRLRARRKGYYLPRAPRCLFFRLSRAPTVSPPRIHQCRPSPDKGTATEKAWWRGLSWRKRRGNFHVFAQLLPKSSKNCKNLACTTGETKLWLSPFAKHLCTRIWVRAMIGLLKSHCRFTYQDDRRFETRFRYFIESDGCPKQGYRRCYADLTYRGWITSVTQVRKMELHGW